MKYPILSSSTVLELGRTRQMSHAVEAEPHVRWEGSGEELNRDGLRGLGRAFAARTDSYTGSDRDALEGELCVSLYEALVEIPIEVLDDPRFWAYLSIDYFWEFISWREQGAFSDDGSSWLKYVDGRISTESVLPRMFLRIQVLGGTEYAALASAIPKSTDFWRSHVLRVRTGSVPAITRALAESQKTDRLTTKPLRILARDYVNRLWTNVVPATYDDDSAKALIQEFRAALDATNQPNS